MINLPDNILQYVYENHGNSIVHYCGECDISFEGKSPVLLSIDPFVLELNGEKFFFTNRIEASIPSGCNYAILTATKPRKKQFQSGEIKCKRWLKHPSFTEKSPDEIVDSWSDRFMYVKEDREHNVNGLRIPQLGAIHAFMSYTQNPKDQAIIVMPTGTGKTETMLSILIANQCKKLLVTVPSDALRTQLADKFISLGVLKIKKFNIVSNECLNPYVAVINRGMNCSDWQQVLNKSNVVVSTMSLLSGTSQDIRNLFFNTFTNVFVDEAHHSVAPSWQQFIDIFNKKKVTLFTATPFRNDGIKLQGDFIYNFSLRDAQKQGYYKEITFYPIREYDKEKADKAIACKAVEVLKSDIDARHDHILLARCANKSRAEEVFKYYEQYGDLNPVIVYSGITGEKKTLNEIRLKQHKIIVCVNMLSEGFDLPEMKIAAIHDPRQSLPVTLQFIGRFTRTAIDNTLGDASFIANIAYSPISEELHDLYVKDVDWNVLLPRLNDGQTQDEIDFRGFIQSFDNIENANVPFQSIQLALSTIMYQVFTNIWKPDGWMDCFPVKDYNYRFGSVNSKRDTLVIILGKIGNVEWGNIDTINNLRWDIVLVHLDMSKGYNHVCINSSLDNLDCEGLVKSIFGENFRKIEGDVVFRVFSGIKRLAIINFGARKGRPGDTSFKAFYGRDVQDGVLLSERKELIKNNIFGYGYKNGHKVSIGCSIKGKIWSYMRGNILQFCKWSQSIGKLVEDASINVDEVFKHTLKITRITSFPQVMPIGIDWDDEIYLYQENRLTMQLQSGKSYAFYDAELQLVERDISPDLEFKIVLQGITSTYKISYGEKEINKELVPFYSVSQIGGDLISFKTGTQIYNDICNYFNHDNCAPVIFFADGSLLFALNYVVNKNKIDPISKDHLLPINWNGVNLANESQHVVPYEKDSIQYHFSQIIKNKFDLLYDDDGSGEVADLVGIQDIDDAVHVHLFHIKYAKDGIVSNQINNLYEVCGQALRSVKWKDRDRTKDLFTRFLARQNKRFMGRTCSRIILGSEDKLVKINDLINYKKDFILHINIVQPSISKDNVSPEILNLLGCVAQYLKETSNIDLNVYCSE